jgi:hypothetical protein
VELEEVLDGRPVVVQFDGGEGFEVVFVGVVPAEGVGHVRGDGLGQPIGRLIGD